LTKENISKIHLELLDQKRQTLLKSIANTSDAFVLGGGTALALQIKHRQSFDFDFFSQKEIPKNLLEKLQKNLKISRVSRDTVDELTFYVDNVKVTFLRYPFEKVFDSVAAENNLKYFPAKTIAIQKAYAIGRRGVYRDYFDLYTLLKDNHTALNEIILGAQDIYGEIFNPKIFLEQLVYFDDLTDFEIIAIKESQTIPGFKQVKEFLEESVKRLIMI